MHDDSLLLKRLKKRLKILFYVLISFLLCVLLGFFYFLFHISHFNKTCVRDKEQAIVALTGGVNRINKAAELLYDGYGRILLISGVNEDFKKKHLRDIANLKNFDQKKIFLGYNSKNTEGNAKETLIFITMHEIDKVLLVTNDYHIPRATLLFESIISNVKISSCVANYKAPLTVKFLEYIKYLSTFILYKVNIINDLYSAYLKGKIVFWKNVATY